MPLLQDRMYEYKHALQSHLLTSKCYLPLLHVCLAISYFTAFIQAGAYRVLDVRTILPNITITTHLKDGQVVRVN